MTTIDTSTSQLVINRPTKTQFNQLTPNKYQLWAVDPEFNGGKILATDSNGEIVETSITTESSLQNTATDSNSMTIEGTVATGSYSVNIGKSSTSYINTTSVGYQARATGGGATAIGKSSKASGNTSVALGALAEANAQGAIMLGGGLNNEAQTFKIALRASSTQATDEASGLFTLLDSNGKIPVKRYTTIVSLDATDSITIASNNIYNGGTQTSLSIALPSGTVDNTFICEINFTSGATATIWSDPGTLKWQGNDIISGVFTPDVNKRYTIMIYYDGVNYVALERGV